MNSSSASSSLEVFHSPYKEKMNPRSDPVLSCIIEYLGTKRYVLLRANGEVFMVPEAHFYQRFIKMLYNNLKQKVKLILPQYFLTRKDTLFGNSDFCSSTLEQQDIRIVQAFTLETLSLILKNLVNEDNELEKINDIDLFVKSKVPFTGKCPHEYLYFHFNRFEED